MADFDVLVWVCRGLPYQGMTYGTRLRERLEAHGLKVRELPYMERSLTADEIACPYHLLSGGEVPVHSDDPRMIEALGQLRMILKRAELGKARVIGTCLGMQMIAAGLTDTHMIIEPDTPINVGLQKITGLPTTNQSCVMAMFHYHRVAADFAKHSMVDKCFATADNPIAGFTAGPHIAGYQGHPELTPNDMRALIDFNSTMINEHGTRTDDALTTIKNNEAKWTVETADQLLAVPFVRDR